MAETIKDFLVSIGYRVDGGSEQKFRNSVETATKGALALATAVAAASAAVTAAVTKIAAGFDELYYASQRTKASAENIKAVGFAVSQLGGSYQGAVSSIEAFALKMRSNPGYESMARNLGVVTRENGRLKDTTVIMTDLARVLAKKPQYVTLQYLEALGIDEATYEALKSGDLVRYTEEYRKKQAALGVDQSRAAAIGKELTQAWRSLGATAAAVGDKLLVSLGPGIKDFVDRVDAFLTRNADKIVAFFERAADWVGKLLAAFVQLVEKGEGPIVEFFDKMTAGVEKMETAFKVFAAFLGGAFLLSVLGSFSKVGAGFAGLLLKLGIPAAAIGAGATAMGYGPGAEALRQGGYAAGAKDPDVAQTVGTAKAAQGAWNWVKRKLGFGGDEKPAGGSGSTAPIQPGSFTDKAPGIMKRLQEDFDLTKEQAAGIVGNLGHESGGLKEMQEKNPVVPGSRGGFGWAQWTGPRRRAFEKWAADKGLDPTSDEANYGFLKHELQTTERGALAALRKTDTVQEATMAFEDSYERAGVKNYPSRYRWANRALRAAERAADSEKTMGSLGFGAFDPSKAARIQGNAAMGQGAFGIGGPVLVPPASSSTNVDMNQKTEITILGGGDPQATAREVAGVQDKVNGGMLRNMAGAVR